MRVARPWLAGIALLASIALIALAYRPARQFLAQENNLGMRLATPGTMIEGAFITRAKSWLGIYSLGEYTTSLGIPLITTEAPWTLPSMADRIQMQQVVLETLISELAER